MNTASGFLGYRGTVDVDWPLVLKFGGVTAIGIVAGSALMQYVPQRALKRAFAVFLVLIGSLILWQYSTL